MGESDHIKPRQKENEVVSVIRILYKVNFRLIYEKMTDQQLVEKVTRVPVGEAVNEEAVAFLLYNRYAPLLSKLYKAVFQTHKGYYEDCLGDLFVYLKGRDLNWNKLRNFEWKCTFGTWLKPIAYRRFMKIKPYLIDNVPMAVSISTGGDEEGDKPQLQLPDVSPEELARNERKVLLLEAIAMLKDEDQKFVILKHLQGYNSKEIALLLQKRWEKHGIVKTNAEGKKVVPTAGYIDVRTQRAKENLMKIITKLNKH